MRGTVVAEHTPYQKGIIKRFYENRDTLALQKLGETVSNLYVETSPAKISRAWKSVHAQLLAAGVPASEAKAITEARDLKELAQLVTALM
jgi:hypothetical protein